MKKWKNFIKFKTSKEEEAFENAYQAYFDKRWEDLPKIKISKQDYDDLVLKWGKIKYEKVQNLDIKKQ